MSATLFPRPVPMIAGSTPACAQETIREAKEATRQILEMRDGMAKAFRDLEIVFPGLEDIESAVVIGQPAPEIDPQKATVFEDSDTIVHVELIDGRYAPSVDDVLALAVPVLQHRMALTFAARAEGMTVRDAIARLVKAQG